MPLTAISTTSFCSAKTRREITDGIAELSDRLPEQQQSLVGLFEIELDTGDVYWSPEMFQLLERHVDLGPLPLLDFLRLVHQVPPLSNAEILPDLLHLSAHRIASALNVDWHRSDNPLDEHIYKVTAGIVPAREQHSARIVGTVSIVKRLTTETDSQNKQSRLDVMNRVLNSIVSGRIVDGILEEGFATLQQGFPELLIAYGTNSNNNLFTIKKCLQFANQESLVGRVLDFSEMPDFLTKLSEGQPIVVADIKQDNKLAPLAELLKQNQTRGIVIVSLRLPQGSIGILLLSSQYSHPWKNSEIAFISETASCLSLALHEAAERQESSRIEERMQFQATLLESQQKTSLDGIVVISHDRRLASFNQRFLEMWNLPLNLAAGDNYDFVLEALLAKVANPVAFLERVEYLYAHSQETACDNILLKDGRTIERYGTPLHGKDGTYYGRISYFRDVTDRIYANDQRQSKLLRSRIMKSILAAREDEQRRIARDLHDIIGQSLVSVGLGLEMAKTEARKALKLSTICELQKMVSVAVADVRLLSRNLRPPVLDDLGLIAALHHMLREHGEQNNLKYDLQHDPERTRRLPEYLETALFRIAQESLTNIVKHAQATQVNLVLKITQESVELTIRDNGCGFQPDEVLLKGTNGGMGLLGIQERIDLLQGSLELRSRPGDGTTLIVSAPCEENFDVCNTDLHR